MRSQPDAPPPPQSLSKNTMYTLGQHIGSCSWAPRALCIVFDRDGGGGPHRVGCACSEFGGRVCFVSFFTRDCGGCEHGAFFVSGWLPVAWGRGCLLIGNNDNPSPKGKKGVGKGNSLNHSRPKGLVGFPETFILHPPADLFTSRIRY